MEKFTNLYGDIKLYFSNITDEFKNKILTKKKINKNNSFKFEDIYNLEYIFIQSYNYEYNHYNIKRTFEDILLSYKDNNGKKIYTKLEVNFIRKNKNYKKLFYYYE